MLPLLFAAANVCNDKLFFGLPTWYKYLDSAGKMELLNGRCELSTTLQVQDLSLIFLAVLDILLRIAGLAAIIFVIYGGIQLITSQGEPEGSKSARQTITNALIGLVIALLATAIVSFVGRRIG